MADSRESDLPGTTCSIPPGTTEMFGDELRLRLAVEAMLRRVFDSYGIDELRTPAFELEEVFNGHHGEGEELLFRMHDRAGVGHVLRYDNTVPLCRWVANNPQLKRPLARYSIADVFRDDTPDLGHFRQFTQCDFDIIGDPTRAADAIVICMACDGLEALFDRFTIRLSHRGLIRAISGLAGISDELGILGVQRALDRADKYTKGGSGWNSI